MPAIDVSYQQAVKSLDKHTGVTVRWSGRIIKTEDIDSNTQPTVIAFPLLEGSKPDSRRLLKSGSARFIVEIKNFDGSCNRQLITAYGSIGGKRRAINGNMSKELPIVSAVETQGWSRYPSYAPYAVEFRHGLPYSGPT